MQGRTRADSGQDRRIRVRGPARACVAKPGYLQNRLRTGTGQGYTGKAKAVHVMKDGALVSVKVTQLVLKKYDYMVA